MRNILLIFIWLFGIVYCIQAANIYPLKGKVIDKLSRQPVISANIYLTGLPDKGAASDTKGYFCIEDVAPGIYSLTVSCLGYKTTITPEYIVSTKTPLIEIELEEDATLLDEITVRSTPLRRLKESPVSLQIIGLQEIEKSPGGNRDISRIVRSFPGVSFSPIGYRNDLIVRGGSPSENRFFLDGIEIPNINHFATQGASGGPVSILNADLISEVQFYTGAFPADKGGALSSVMDIRLRESNPESNSYKATLGASEISLSGTGHIGEKTSYLFSVRQSYLQLLFKMLGLPFLPNFIDGQFKVKTRLNSTNEISLLGLAGIDDMKLNTDETGEEAEYLLSYLPRIKQQTFTLGSVYRHYAGQHIQTVSVGYNYLHNNNLKYKNNDTSSEDNLTLRLNSTEQKVSLKAENRSYLDQWTLSEGIESYYAHYSNQTYQKVYQMRDSISNYTTGLGVWGWGMFVSARYTTPNERFSATAGLRLDGCNYTSDMQQFWKQLSPRFSFSYKFLPNWSLNGSTGIYHQLPPYTAMGLKDNEGLLINQSLRYMRVYAANMGIEWTPNEQWATSVEGFYKSYSRVPLSLIDQIPLACKGNDYGVVGNEPLISTASGRSYGLEASLRWQKPGKFNAVSSFTLYKSEYRNNPQSPYIASAWDNRFILNLSGTYELPRRWSIGAKVSCIGGAPYTPYDTDKSSLVEAWDAQGRPYYDYSRYNTERLSTFAQVDMRIDKRFYFRRCMFGIYIDLQNVTMSRLRQQDVLMSTGEIINPSSQPSEQRYKMKYIKQDSGTLMPTLGLTLEI